MKRILVCTAALAVLGTAFCLTAQSPREGRRPPVWDAFKLVTVTGTIVAVETDPENPGRPGREKSDRPERGKGEPRGGRRGPGSLMIRLKSGASEYLIMTGPAPWLQEQGFTFKAGETLTVSGMRHDRDERAVIAAARITRAGKTLVLRNGSGEPQWPRPERRGGGNR
jgi:hypothetical protein